MSHLKDERKQLEVKIREQNLIHELVIINELLLMEQEKLKKQVNRIPRLEQKILDLEKENQKRAGQQQSRIGLARQEAIMQKQGEVTFPQYHKTIHALTEGGKPSNPTREKVFSKPQY